MNTVTVRLTPAAMEALRIPVQHHKTLGGFQTLLLACQRALTHDGTLTLERGQAERVVAYASGKYGSGGMQGRLALFAPLLAVELAKLPPLPVTGTLDL